MSDTIFYCPDIYQQAQLSEQESQHCVRVLRMKEGDKISVTDGKGGFYVCSILQAHPKHCIINVDEKIDKPKTWIYNLHIGFAPTKNMDRNEWFIEKAAEIGIDELSPLLCRFSERKEIKTERVQKILVSAMKQSQQSYLPKLNKMVSFDEFISQPFIGKKFIAHCYGTPKNPLAQKYCKGENALILIGPEGDFSEDEVKKAIAKGFEPVSLSTNRLRTETACLVALHTIHVLNY